MPAYPNLLNQATRNPESVKTWVLAELGDLVLPDDSPAVGILGPSRTSANALAAEIYSLPVATAETPGLLSRMISRSYGLQTLWNQFVGLPPGATSASSPGNGSKNRVYHSSKTGVC